MTVCSVNTGPGLLPPVHWRRLEITVLPDIVSAIRLLWWADIFSPQCMVIMLASHQSPPCLHIPTLHLDPMITSTLKVSAEFHGTQYNMGRYSMC